MRYDSMRKGIFLKRPNRFLAHVLIDGKDEICHVKNTGRCKELLREGTEVWVQEHDNPARKTKFSLITVKKGKYFINMDSQAPNAAAAEWLPTCSLFQNVTLFKREQKFGNSRFDCYLEYDQKRCFVEVKGVTLEEGGVVRFPDAPTERGTKHVLELCKCVEAGYEAIVLFVVQMHPVHHFEPNNNTDPAFAAALQYAAKCGVKILAVDCNVTPDSMTIHDFIPVKLCES